MSVFPSHVSIHVYIVLSTVEAERDRRTSRVFWSYTLAESVSSVFSERDLQDTSYESS